MQTLGYAALVVETVIVPALLFKLFAERQTGYSFSRTVHRFLLWFVKSVPDV
jgi:hypothetical protein